jgi:hypothetical protein
MRRYFLNDFEAKWLELAPKGHAAGRLRVYPDHKLDFFIDYSLSGNRELIIEAKAFVEEIDNLPTFASFEVVQKKLDGSYQIGLILTDNQLMKTFSVMCYDIAERSKQGVNILSSLAIAVETIRSWSQLLRIRKKQGLSRNEVIGLWGEVFTLMKILIDQDKYISEIIYGWRGPDTDQRDLGFNGTRVEIKTQLSTKSITLKISSLDQLDDGGGRLKIALNRISPSVDGHSLSELIESVILLIEGNNLILSEFERKIELSGYDHANNFANEKFGLDECIIYSVVESFPKLTRTNVPPSIIKVEYEIDGNQINNYKILWSELLECFNEIN